MPLNVIKNKTDLINKTIPNCGRVQCRKGWDLNSFNMKDFFKNIDTGKIIRLALLVGGGVAVYFLVKKFSKSREQIIGETSSGDIVSEILQDSQNSAQIAQAATISQLTAKSIAQKIQNAWGFLNDDEDAIYKAFAQINNLADLMLVIQMYGQYKHEDLAEALQSRLNEKELQKVNLILQSKGINYQF